MRTTLPAIWMLLLLVWGSSGCPASANANGAPVERAKNPDAVCAGCHRAIYDRYEKTPMREASGPAVEGLIPGEFTHRASGIHYQLSLEGKRAWLQYDRPHPPPGRFLAGKQELSFFVGSGVRGRTYLFNQDGWWFEAPVNWYGKKQVWDMAPNYLSATEMPFTLPVDANCLHCHASDVQQALPGSRNHFAAEPFLAGGVTCASCHGDASEHVRSSGKAAVLNPDKLDAARRDSVCLQCHLEGETAVYENGRSLSSYRPGDLLFADVKYFVHKGEIGSGGRATSEWEALLQSACKRGSGEKLTCTTCHDPHGTLARGRTGEEQRVRFYREKCLGCHTGETFRTAHHPEQPDCAHCHMPRSPSEDIAHEQVTDHRIQRRPSSTSPTPSRSPELVAVGATVAVPTESDRDLGLAYAQIAHTGARAEGERALTLLKRAEAASPGPDMELNTELGFLEQSAGDTEGAAREYQAAIAADAANSTVAAGNLAVLRARGGAMPVAMTLWGKIFAEDPTQLAAGFNFAVGQCMTGEPAQALVTLQRLLRFSPDNLRARELASAIAGGQANCSAAAPAGTAGH